MRGSPIGQVQKIWDESGIFKGGESRDAAKEAARAAGATQSQDVAKHTAIYSFKTGEAYKDTWVNFAVYCRDVEGLKDLEKVTAAHVESYLGARIEQGVSLATWKQDAAALGKLETALTMRAEKLGNGQVFELRAGISRDLRQDAKETLTAFAGNRAYMDARAVVGGVKNELHQLGAKLQLEAGGRLNEVAKIEAGQLKGTAIDLHTGKEVGLIEIHGKGGKIGDLRPSLETYRAIEREVLSAGRFQIDKSEYRESLRAAAGDQYEGKSTHGLRWNFAQERMGELGGAGLKYEQALQVVSWEMGHERADITEHYLGK